MLYTLFSTSNRPRWQKALYFVFFTSLIAIPLLIFKSCENNASPDLAKISLVINGKKYMLALGSYEEINKSVPLGFVAIYKDDEAFFVRTTDLKTIANTMGGNVDLFEFKEASHDGYFSVNNQDTLYHEQSEIVTTATIGEQITKTTVTLRNKANRSMNIAWSFSDKTSEFKAGKNCEMHSFWIKTTVQPGETNISTQGFLVIPLSRLAKFYGCSVSYDEETKVLFIKK